MHKKQKGSKAWETMTFAERGEYMKQIEESIRQYGNKGLLLLFCLMKETGIRFGDILDITTENLQDKKLFVIERKYGGIDYYRNPDGSLPVISEATAELLVSGEDGKFFHHDKRYYIVVLRKAFPSKEFKFHYIRQYVTDMWRMQKRI